MWRADPSQILIAIALDALLGDPRGWPHIARWTGRLSVAFETLLTGRFRRSVPLGAVFWGLVAGSMFAVYAAARRACAAINPLAARILDTLVIYQAIAAADLARHVEEVARPLSHGRLAEARRRLASIVGRDTGALDEAEICRAAIESVAESTTDAVIAPLFWSVIAGAPGALLYRAANTLDSMVGHRTEAYEEFGKAAARIDDVLNWLPARMCAAAFCAVSPEALWAAVRREAAGHSSPNAGWSEAAMARALGVRLGGDNFYDGQRACGPVFNAAARPPRLSDVEESVAWMRRGSCACAAVLVALSITLKWRRSK